MILEFSPILKKTNSTSGFSLFWTFFSEIAKYPLEKVEILLTASTIHNLRQLT